MFSENKFYFLGVLAALATVTIWAAFLIGTRFAVSGNLTVDEVLILRLVPAFLIMLPLMFKLGIFIKGQSVFSLFMIALGALGKLGAAHAHYIIKDEIENVMEQVCTKNISEVKKQTVSLGKDFFLNYLD